MRHREPRPIRLTIRLPEQLQSTMTALAASASRSVADWIVVTPEGALTRYHTDQPLRFNSDGTYVGSPYLDLGD